MYGTIEIDATTPVSYLFSHGFNTGSKFFANHFRYIYTLKDHSVIDYEMTKSWATLLCH